MNPNIAEGFRIYCRASGRSVAFNVEAAITEYMRSHPLPQVRLNFTQDIRLALSATPDLDGMESRLISDDLKEVIAIMRRLNSTGRGDFKAFKRQMKRTMRQALKVRHPDGELLRLLREAEDLL